MPIKFRCPYCRQFLGISRAKAGAVTDCPTCGRTIRVPGLDGKIAPLPKPELNYADRGLAQALDELANLGLGEVSNAAKEQGVATPPMPKPVAMVLAPPPAIEAVALPVPLPPEPRLSAGSSEQGVETASDAHPSVSNSDKLWEPLGQLAAMSPERSRDASPPKRMTAQLLAAGAGCVFVGLVIGVLIGRMSGGVTSTASPPMANFPPEAAPVVAPPAVPLPAVPEAGPWGPLTSPPPDGASPVALPLPASDRQRAIVGLLSYVNADGETRPDSGARVLVLPLTREGASKLAVDSFRTGATDTDLRVAQASIRALGGDFVVSGPDGRYEVHLPVAGEYRLIIVSRYQGRDSSGEGERAEIAALKDWFDKPQLFLGQTQSTLTTVPFDGQASVTRDHVFPKAE